MIGITGDGSTSLGPTRREWLRLGALAPLGLALPRLLAGEQKRPARSCLLIFMDGGPSHVDLWDMKPDAPAEVRGEFRPIRTRVPGLHVCDHLPLFARQAHRFTFIRSMRHSVNDHNAGTYYHLTGRSPVEGGKLIVANSPKNFPPFGAVLAKLRPSGGRLPDFVHLPEFQSNNGHDIAGQSSGFLGAAYDPFIAGDPSLPGYELPGLESRPDVPDRRLRARDELLGRLDRRLASPADAARVFTRKAFDMIAAPQVRRAFDLSREPMKVRERYGTDPGSDRAIEARKFGGLPHLGQSMLLARRLIEAGVRLVTLFTGRRIDQAWDTHRDHFPLLKRSLCPPFDRAVSALMEDLAERGLLDETLVVIVGEFGRTPKLGQITSGAGATANGRDHWPYCYTALLAGAGVPAGKVIGASDGQGAYPRGEAYTPEDLAATVYELMGVPAETEIRDPLDRPYAVALGTPIKGVVG
jgi:hypothetical protein